MFHFIFSIFLLFFLVLLPSPVNAGESSELMAKLAQTSDSDIAKLEIYTDLVQSLRRSDPDQALIYAERGLQLHQRHQQPAQKAKLIGYSTKIYLERKQLDLAESLIEEGIAAAKQSQDSKALGINLFNQALLFQLSNQLILAMDSYRGLERIYKQAGDLKQLAAVFNNMGTIAFKLGNFESALRHYQLAMPLYEEIQSPVHQANTTMNIGEIFYLLKDYQQARENYLTGLSTVTEQEAPLSHLEGHHRLGMLSQASGQFEQALEEYNKALKLAQNYNLAGAQISINYELIKLAGATADANLMQQSLTRAEALLNDQLQGELVMSMDYFRAFVAAKQQNWPEAERHIDSLFANRFYNPRYFILQDALNLAYEIKSALAKPAEANRMILGAFNHYLAHQKERRDNQLSQYSQLYKTKEKEHQLANLQRRASQQENEKLKSQQQFRFYLFASILVVISLVMLVALSWFRAKAIRREHQLSQALMAQKKQFFSDISHELRTPLTLFKLKMEELEYDIADDPKSVYKLLHERIDSFNCLINDISLLASNDKGELELETQPVHTKAFFVRAGAELQTLAGQSDLAVEVKVTLSETATACFDVSRMRQVLANLFSNACRYTASPGRISFRVYESRESLNIELQDSAPGLSEQEYKKIFERLYRVDKSRSRKLGGSGLGLSICRDIVELHAGSIQASKSELGGVSILVSIPLQ